MECQRCTQPLPPRRRSFCSDECSKRARLEAEYGLGPGEYLVLLEAQNGVCAICQRRQRYQSLSIDHDHKTGRVRGLLCKRCNHDLLAAALESAEVLRRAADYLVDPPAEKTLGVRVHRG